MDIRRNLFLIFGLCRGYPSDRRTSPGAWRDKVVEPREAKACRRNTIVLAAGIVLAWASGAELTDLDLFGIKPAEEHGVVVLSLAAMLVHSYWYVARYWHLRENSTRRIPASFTEIQGGDADIDWEVEWNEAAYVSLRVTDWLANWAAVLLTPLSWYILVVWIVDTHTMGN